MKTVISIKSLLYHEALGHLFHITFDDGSVANIYEEWFIMLLNPNYEGKDSLIGMGFEGKWIDRYSLLSK